MGSKAAAAPAAEPARVGREAAGRRVQEVPRQPARRGHRRRRPPRQGQQQRVPALRGRVLGAAELRRLHGQAPLLLAGLPADELPHNLEEPVHAKPLLLLLPLPLLTLHERLELRPEVGQDIRGEPHAVRAGVEGAGERGRLRGGVRPALALPPGCTLHIAKPSERYGLAR